MDPSHETFNHPFQPYDIQIQFMKSLYQCIEESNVGIFESPTGTGKSLSLICGSLTWLRDNERRLYHGVQDVNDKDLDWLARAERESQLRVLLDARQELEQKLASVREQEARKRGQDRNFKRIRTDDTFREQDFTLDDYESEPDNPPSVQTQSLSSTTQALLARIAPRNDRVDLEDEEHRTKIIFCSRTHSQLTQIVHELRRVTVRSGIVHTGNEDFPEYVKHLPLGSRKNLCINSKVNRLPSTTAINERCLELQKPGLSKDMKCEFMPIQSSIEDQSRVQSFKEHAVAQIRDIEDICKVGENMKLCPYYASRSAIPIAEVLTLPYPLLLQKSARDALGVQVKNSVVIIDEAHNLMDAIADTLSVVVPLSHLELAKTQVTGYCQKFKNKLKGKNRAYLAQVIRMLKSIITQIQELGRSVTKESTISANRILNDSALDQIQPYKVLRYLQDSKLVYKVEGYAEYIAEKDQVETSKSKDEKQKQPRGVLAEFQNLLIALMNPASEGIFLVSQSDQDIVLKYTLLDAREHFRQVVEEARSVILAGGTMSPMSDYADRLFSYLAPSRLKSYSFGHVVDKSNLMIEAIMSGPNGVKFDFTYQNRMSTTLIIELGKLMEMACKRTPDGCVAFFPSYEYLAFVVKTLKRDTLFDRIAALKPVFVESKGMSADELLQEYGNAISSGKGGFMLAVVGGKLSEGINFSDRLGRTVICVGLPYPNIQSVEWKAKVKYVESSHYEKLKSRGMPAGIARTESEAVARDFTDNITMRAVNQSIGRAIRHKNDYAAVLLVDERYTRSRIQSKLPKWMASEGVSSPGSWQEIEDELARFFNGHRASVVN